MNFLKRTIPLIIAFVMGVMMVLQYYVPHEASQSLLKGVSRWGITIGGFAVFFGAYSLFHLHGTKIKRKLPGWGYSVLVFLGAGITIILGLHNGGEGFWQDMQKDTMFDWIYFNVQVPAGATMFSILAFFMASAAYRTFRARTTEATILLVAAVIVMLGRVPVGGLIWEFLPPLSDWIMSVPNMAAKRAVLIGVSIGAITTALKIIFGIERAYLGGGK